MFVCSRLPMLSCPCFRHTYYVLNATPRPRFALRSPCYERFFNACRALLRSFLSAFCVVSFFFFFFNMHLLFRPSATTALALGVRP